MTFVALIIKKCIGEDVCRIQTSREMKWKFVERVTVLSSVTGQTIYFCLRDKSLGGKGAQDFLLICLAKRNNLVSADYITIMIDY